LPGRTQTEAYKAFVEPLSLALSCISNCKLIATPRSGPTQTIALNPSPLRLPGSEYQLFANQSFKYVHEGSSWRVSTISYEYAIEVSATGQEVVAFHWEGHEAGAVPYPHMHLGHANRESTPHLGPKSHIPTGRVPLEDVVYFAIRELGVKPLRDDWEATIASARERFIRYKSW
jgi:hypothetical protein